MAVAIRTITRIQDADDAPSLGAGQDGQALVWDNASGAFVATALFTNGLLATGATTGATSQAQTFTNGIVGPAWKPASDSTTALQMQNAAGTAVLTVDTSNNRVSLPHGTIYAGATPMMRFNAALSNIFLGSSGNASATGGNNVAFGEIALANVTTGVNNFAAGYGTLYNTTTGNNNFALGTMAMTYATANGSVAVGNYSGFNSGSNSVFLGYMAGYYETGSSKLFIDNQQRANEANGRLNALLYGEFNADPGAQLLRANALLQAHLTDSATNTASEVLRLSHNTSGTPANGFGSRIQFELQSSTTADQAAAAIKVLWNDATHASRKADLVLTAYDSGGEREGLRIRGDGSGPALGFYGVAPIARAVLATGAGATVDNVITALQNLGLVKQS